MTTQYIATFARDDTTPEDLYCRLAHLEENGPYTVDQVVALCQANGVEAKLYDEPGTLLGWVHPDGTWGLT
ncbi:MAG: hypothetical protein ACRDQZ_22800 [Mycobacteriales bacterium]